jgi:sigma-E factor negative regulatory protein RseA
MYRLPEQLRAAVTLRNRGGGDAMTETLSNWSDGELDREHAHQLPLQLKLDADLHGKWDCYHLIGDALRGVYGPDLSAKIRARLDAEPTVLAPRWRRITAKLHRHTLPAVVSAAAVVFVAFVGFVALRGVQQDVPPTAAIPKPYPEQVAVAAGEGADAYLLAHQRYSPSNEMQGIAPYVRTVAAMRRPPFNTSGVHPGAGLTAKPCLCTE